MKLSVLIFSILAFCSSSFAEKASRSKNSLELSCSGNYVVDPFDRVKVPAFTANEMKKKLEIKLTPNFIVSAYAETDRPTNNFAFFGLFTAKDGLFTSQMNWPLPKGDFEIEVNIHSQNIQTSAGIADYFVLDCSVTEVE